MKEYEKAKEAANYVANKIYRIPVTDPTPSSKAELANLRRGAGKRPGEIPDLWGSFLQSLPEELLGDREPSRGEWAVYIALTMFALHQQGTNSEMHKKDGGSLGWAVGSMVKTDDDQKRIIRRFNAIATSSDMKEMSYHLRTMIQLLRTEQIPLDYAGLAYDIYMYQLEGYQADIRLKWGRDFYSAIYSKLNSKDID